VSDFGTCEAEQLDELVSVADGGPFSARINVTPSRTCQRTYLKNGLNFDAALLRLCGNFFFFFKVSGAKEFAQPLGANEAKVRLSIITWRTANQRVCVLRALTKPTVVVMDGLGEGEGRERQSVHGPQRQARPGSMIQLPDSVGYFTANSRSFWAFRGKQR